MIGLSDAACGIQQSEIRIMSVECEKVRGINLAQGVCDTEVPEVVRRAAAEAMEAGVNSYTRLDGLADLRQGIAGKMREFNRIEADPECEIVVTAGSTGGFYCACLSLLNLGDEVIVFEPYYGYHVNTLLAIGAVPVFITLRAPDWAFSGDDLERVISPRTRAVIVNSPGNPSGKVFSRREMDVIAECAVRHDLVVITDEIYEYFVYDGREHISPGSLSGMADRTITISGFSKVFSITGWRIGYAVCAARWAHPIGYFHDLAYICAPAPLQRGVAVGLNRLGQDFYRDLLDSYIRKRNLICEALQHAGLTPFVPEGAYYVLADASRLPGSSSKEKAMCLLAKTGVASVPGASFYQGEAGENLLRFCFAKKDRDLAEACNRLEQLKSLPVVI